MPIVKNTMKKKISRQFDEVYSFKYIKWKEYSIAILGKPKKWRPIIDCPLGHFQQEMKLGGRTWGERMLLSFWWHEWIGGKYRPFLLKKYCLVYCRSRENQSNTKPSKPTENLVRTFSTRRKGKLSSDSDEETLQSLD